MPGTGTYLALWSSLVALYLIAPCIFSRNQRQRWYLRWTLRRWHVEHLLTMQTSQSLLPEEEEERLRNDFLTKKLENFTMTVKSEMFLENQSLDQDPSPSEEREDNGMDIVTEKKAEKENNDDIDGAVARNVENTEGEVDGAKCYATGDEEAPPDFGLMLDYTESYDDGIICDVPLAGDRKTEGSVSNPRDVDSESKQPHQPTRNVANSCPICLSRFEAGSQLCWSGNPKCLHVFHHDCIMDWLQTTGRKKLKSFRRERGDSSRRALIRQVTKFPMDCPCCRRCFVIQDDDEENGTNKENEDVDVDGNELEIDEEQGQAQSRPEPLATTSSEEASS